MILDSGYWILDIEIPPDQISLPFIENRASNIEHQTTTVNIPSEIGDR
jgi:hypothetical protein